jgi:hypothetical protein
MKYPFAAFFGILAGVLISGFLFLYLPRHIYIEEKIKPDTEINERVNKAIQNVTKLEENSPKIKSYFLVLIDTFEYNPKDKSIEVKEKITEKKYKYINVAKIELSREEKTTAQVRFEYEDVIQEYD